MWGSALGLLPGHILLVAGRRAVSILFLLNIYWQHLLDTIKMSPAEWAHSSCHSSLLDAAKAEVMEAQGHAGCMVTSQVDGAWVFF